MTNVCGFVSTMEVNRAQCCFVEQRSSQYLLCYAEEKVTVVHIKFNGLKVAEK